MTFHTLLLYQWVVADGIECETLEATEPPAQAGGCNTFLEMQLFFPLPCPTSLSLLQVSLRNISLISDYQKMPSSHSENNFSLCFEKYHSIILKTRNNSQCGFRYLFFFHLIPFW